MGANTYLKLLVEGTNGGDPGCDDSQESGSNDRHGTLNAAQAYQKRLYQPTCTCKPQANTETMRLTTIAYYMCSNLELVAVKKGDGM